MCRWLWLVAGSFWGFNAKMQRAAKIRKVKFNGLQLHEKRCERFRQQATNNSLKRKRRSNKSSLFYSAAPSLALQAPILSLFSLFYFLCESLRLFASLRYKRNHPIHQGLSVSRSLRGSIQRCFWFRLRRQSANVTCHDLPLLCPITNGSR